MEFCPVLDYHPDENEYYIHTLEGDLHVSNFIIKGEYLTVSGSR